jgi:hypothetical protein
VTSYVFAIETSDDGLPNETPWKIWQVWSSGTEADDITGPAVEFAQAVLDMYLMDHGPAGGHDVRVAIWDAAGPMPLEDIRTAAAVVYAPESEE